MMPNFTNAFGGDGSSYDLSSIASADGDVKFGSNTGPVFGGGSGLSISTPVLLSLGALAVAAVYFMSVSRK